MVFAKGVARKFPPIVFRHFPGPDTASLARNCDPGTRRSRKPERKLSGQVLRVVPGSRDRSAYYSKFTRAPSAGGAHESFAVSTPTLEARLRCLSSRKEKNSCTT